MTKELNLTFITDPGHGWLAVPLSLVEELGIKDIITNCSYFDDRNNICYLEEDCDASVFVKVAKEKGYTFNVRESCSRMSDSWVRGLPHYPFNTNPTGYREVLAS
jgi:hypothetical protein